MNIKRVLIFFSVAFLCLSCNELLDSPLSKVVFTKVDAISVGARANASSFVIGDNGYVIFGRFWYGSDRTGTDCWQYNQTLGVWTQKATFPGKPRVSAIAEVVDGMAYVGFGFDFQMDVYDPDTTILDDFWQYNPSTDKWLKRASFPAHYSNAKPPLNSCSSFSYKQYIYIVGLSNEKKYFNEVWRYDTLKDEWTRMKDFPGDNRQSAVTCTDGEKFYFGTGYHTYCRNDWWQYFPESDTWKERKSIPGKGRVNAVAFSVDHRFFVATGRNVGGTLTDDYTHSDILEYNVATDKWYKRADYPGGKAENALAFVINGTAYMGFGENNSGMYDQLWKFEP